MGQIDITQREQIEKIEKIASGINLDTLAYVMGVLHQRQQAIDSIRRNKNTDKNIGDYASYFNCINDLINKALITKI